MGSVGRLSSHGGSAGQLATRFVTKTAGLCTVVFALSKLDTTDIVREALYGEWLAKAARVAYVRELHTGKVLGHACQPLTFLLVLAMMRVLTVRSAGAVPVPGILHGR